jgi:hypothetical protein
MERRGPFSNDFKRIHNNLKEISSSRNVEDEIKEPITKSASHGIPILVAT